MNAHTFNPGYATTDELRSLSFSHIGDNVMIARNCTIIGLENIRIGDNVRIDGYTTISAASGHCRIGRNIHIGSGSHLACAAGIELADFVNLSQGVRIYTISDDYSGSAMTNPTVPRQFTNVTLAPVSLGKHVIIGSGSVVLPGSCLSEGVAVGALSLVNRSLDPWSVYAGIPVRLIRARSKDLLNAEQHYLNLRADSQFQHGVG